MPCHPFTFNFVTMHKNTRMGGKLYHKDGNIDLSKNGIADVKVVITSIFFLGARLDMSMKG